MSTVQEFYAPGKEGWRKWLEENHGTKKGVWLIFYKSQTGKPSLPYDDAVEEALRYGWIDSIIKKIDDERYARKFTPRKPHSTWSESNISRVEKMIREGRMGKEGLLMVEQSKANGEFEPIKPPPKVMETPQFMKDALDANEAALLNFNKLPPSHKRQYIAWLLNAKKDETRKKRLSEAISLLERDKKLGLK